MLDERTDVQRYYDALESIARKFQTPEQLRRSAKHIGLTPDEHIEMAYENIQGVAKAAIRGKRRPRDRR